MLSRGRNKRRRGKIYFFLGQEKNILFWEFCLSRAPVMWKVSEVKKKVPRNWKVPKSCRCRRIAGAEEVAGAEEGHQRVKRCRIRMGMDFRRNLKLRFDLRTLPWVGPKCQRRSVLKLSFWVQDVLACVYWKVVISADFGMCVWVYLLKMTWEFGEASSVLGGVFLVVYPVLVWVGNSFGVCSEQRTLFL